MNPELSGQNIPVPWFFVLFFGIGILTVFVRRIVKHYFSLDSSLPPISSLTLFT